MPGEEYICTDNFFKKMTDLDSPKKNNDCYFYYYSTCAKGDSCTFRHEPSALGCETMCSFWKEGKCVNVHCNFRHMELRKNRKAIQCYWESQPGGCLKPHCPFMHQSSKGDGSVKSDKSDNRLNDSFNTNDTFKNSPAVDSLVVNFEEESDSESAPAFSPVKQGLSSNKMVKVKTLEEIKLEKIQAASAAYYSYHPDTIDPTSSVPSTTDSDDLRQRILNRMKNKHFQTTQQQISVENKNTIPVKRKLSNDELADILGDDSLRKSDISEKVKNTENMFKKQKIQNVNLISTDFKIKTLKELRAERVQIAEKTTEEFDESVKIGEKRKIQTAKIIRLKKSKLDDDQTAEVSSTSMDCHIPETVEENPTPDNNDNKNATSEEAEFDKKPVVVRRLNLKRRKAVKEEENIINSSDDKIDNKSEKQLEEDNLKINRLSGDKIERNVSEDVQAEVISNVNSDIDLSNSESLKTDLDKNETVDELVLLCEDDDVDLEDNVNIKAEDDLLNEIDDLLGD